MFAIHQDEQPRRAYKLIKFAIEMARMSVSWTTCAHNAKIRRPCVVYGRVDIVCVAEGFCFDVVRSATGSAKQRASVASVAHAHGGMVGGDVEELQVSLLLHRGDCSIFQETVLGCSHTEFDSRHSLVLYTLNRSY